jgi:hypothetical protein
VPGPSPLSYLEKKNKFIHLQINTTLAGRLLTQGCDLEFGITGDTKDVTVKTEIWQPLYLKSPQEDGNSFRLRVSQMGTKK